MYLQIKMSQKEKFKNGAIITTSLVWLEDPAVWIVSIMSRAKYICNLKTTRTARMPAFWGYPPLPHNYLPILVIHIRSQVKTRQSQGYKIKEFAKISNLWIMIIVVYLTQLLKLLDKIRKYKMDPASIVEDTEQTQFCPQTDRQTDRQMDKVKSVYSLQLCWAEGKMTQYISRGDTIYIHAKLHIYIYE